MPSIPNMIKNVQQMRTTFPIGRSDDSNVITTNLRPGARLITLYTTKHHVTQGHIQKYGLVGREGVGSRPLPSPSLPLEVGP